MSLSICSWSDGYFETETEGPLSEKQAEDAQRMWNDGFLNSNKFRIFEQYIK